MIGLPTRTSSERRALLAAPADWHGARPWAPGVASIRRALLAAGAMLRQLTLGFVALRVHCLLVGHDDGFAREPNRLLLRCTICGRRTPGWAISMPPPRGSSRFAEPIPVGAVQADPLRHHARAFRVRRDSADRARCLS